MGTPATPVIPLEGAARGTLLRANRTFPLRVLPLLADESAVSDGGEDQGAEEAFMGYMPRESHVPSVFWKAVSRFAHGSPFSALACSTLAPQLGQWPALS